MGVEHINVTTHAIEVSHYNFLDMDKGVRASHQQQV